ncbi:MAG: hypothetical protein E6G62_06110, partial [Actinobacteria bacterium]
MPGLGTARRTQLEDLLRERRFDHADHGAADGHPHRQPVPAREQASTGRIQRQRDRGVLPAVQPRPDSAQVDRTRRTPPALAAGLAPGARAVTETILPERIVSTAVRRSVSLQPLTASREQVTGTFT